MAEKSRKRRKFDPSKKRKRWVKDPVIKKRFEELISWKQLYTTVGAYNKNAAKKIDLEIEDFKKQHNLD